MNHFQWFFGVRQFVCILSLEQAQSISAVKVYECSFCSYLMFATIIVDETKKEGKKKLSFVDIINLSWADLKFVEEIRMDFKWS